MEIYIQRDRGKGKERERGRGRDTRDRTSIRGSETERKRAHMEGKRGVSDGRQRRANRVLCAVRCGR